MYKNYFCEIMSPEFPSSEAPVQVNHLNHSQSGTADKLA